VSVRLDVIARLVPEGVRLLDVGCGEGTLLSRLAREKKVRGYGLEIDPHAVAAAVAQGLSVVQGDAENDLGDYPDKAFDIVVLSNSVQTFRAPLPALRQALRVGTRAVVAFPNFGHWQVRASFLTSGMMPRSRALPESWHETQNIHLCTVRDFLFLCEGEDVTVETAYALAGDEARPFDPHRPGFANLLAQEAVFLLSSG
jgi:methionine biosynthesis protein MetW